MRIATRLTLLLLLAVALVMAGFAYLRNQQDRQRLVGEVQQEALVLANAIKLVAEHALRDHRPQDIQQMLAEMVQEQYPIDRVRIYDRRLEETASASAGAAAPPSVPREEIAAILESGRNLVRYLDTARPVVYVILPLRGRRGEAVGVLEVVQAASRVRSEISKATRETVLRFSLLSLTIALVIWMAARVNIRRPLDRLVQATLAFGRGEFDKRISHRRRDEIGLLAAAFNRMAEELQRTQGELIEQGQTRLELERQLQQGQKLAAGGRLASEVAHEVGTPLNIIAGRAESIRKELPAGHPAERHAATILRQTERITGSLRELLDYTRPRRPAVRPHPLSPLLSRLVELLEPLAQRRGVDLKLRVAAGLLPIQADADLFQQALMNLVMNALDATPPGGGLLHRHGAGRGRPALSLSPRRDEAPTRSDGPGLAGRSRRPVRGDGHVGVSMDQRFVARHAIARHGDLRDPSGDLHSRGDLRRRHSPAGGAEGPRDHGHRADAGGELSRSAQLGL